MDSLGWEHGLSGEHGASNGADDDEQGGGSGAAHHDAYDLAALNLSVLLDSMRRGDLALRRRLLAHGRTCRPLPGSRSGA